MMEVTPIATKPELESFCELLKSSLGIHLPYLYAERGSAVGFYENGKLIGGGLVISCRGTFRTVEILPPEVRKKSGIDSIFPYDLSEIFVVWDGSYTPEAYDFWRPILTEIRKSRKSWFITPHFVSNETMNELYKPLDLNYLYNFNRNDNEEIKVGISNIENASIRIYFSALKSYVKSAILRRRAA
jgi:hypothetical protein